MSVQKIDYEDKIGLQNDPNIPDKNKVTDEDMNEIKSKVNNNADELTTAQQNIENLQTGQGTASGDITSLKNRVTTLETDNTTNKQDISSLKSRTTTLETDNETNKTNISTLQEDVEEIEGNITEIQQEQTAQNKKIQELDDNQIHITTEKSDNLNVKDASGQNAKIKLFGISRQETREGYNLANLDRETYTKNGVTVTNNGDGSFTLNGTSTSAGDLMLTQNEDISKSIYNFENANYLLKTFVKSGSFANSGNVAVQTVCMGQLNGQTSYNILNDRLYLNEFTDTDEIAENSFLARIEMYIGGAGVTFNNYTIQILLAKSNDINLEYEQYGASPSPEYPSEIKNTGDNINLFNKETVENNTYVNATTGQVQSYTGSSSSDYIDIKGLKAIILSGDDVVRSNGGAFYNSEKVYISGFTTPQIWNGIQVPSNANYVRVTVTTTELDVIKLEKGTKVTGYSAYGLANIDTTIENEDETQSQTITFPLAEGQKLYNGDYLADDGIHHKRKQVVLDGTENWQLNTTNTFIVLNFDNMKANIGLCSHYKFATEGLVNVDYGVVIGPNHLYIKDKDINTVEEFKTYLAQQKANDTPVVLEYELAEEEIEAYTEEQQEAYNQLQNAKTYKTVTNVFTENAELEMEYIADTKTYIDNEINSVKEELNTIKELLSTTTTSAMLLDNMQSDLESEVL